MPLFRRNGLATRNAPCAFGLPPLLLLPRAHEALGRNAGDTKQASGFARGAWVMSLYERGDVPAGGEGGSAAVYGLDSTPAEGA